MPFHSSVVSFKCSDLNDGKGKGIGGMEVSSTYSWSRY